jgi:hypothetical protein
MDTPDSANPYRCPHSEDKRECVPCLQEALTRVREREGRKTAALARILRYTYEMEDYPEAEYIADRIQVLCAWESRLYDRA